MDWMIGATAVLFILCFLTVVTPVTVRLHFQYAQKKQDILMRVSFWHIFYKKIDLPVLSLEEETGSIVAKEKTGTNLGEAREKERKETPQELQSQWQALSVWLRHLDDMRPLFFSFLNKWKIKRFSWKTRFGTGDAAWTGLLSGLSWSVKQTAAGLLSAVMQMTCRPEVDVSPDFQNRQFETELTCMVTVRLGHAIITGIRVMTHVRGNIFALWKKSKAERRREEAS
ncbi:DUF2953 domain-containing protein [Salibacterium sp. K-3]